MCHGLAVNYLLKKLTFVASLISTQLFIHSLWLQTTTKHVTYKETSTKDPCWRVHSLQFHLEYINFYSIRRTSNLTFFGSTLIRWCSQRRKHSPDEDELRQRLRIHICYLWLHSPAIRHTRILGLDERLSNVMKNCSSRRPIDSRHEGALSSREVLTATTLSHTNSDNSKYGESYLAISERTISAFEVYTGMRLRKLVCFWVRVCWSAYVTRFHHHQFPFTTIASIPHSHASLHHLFLKSQKWFW
jgi:hypothetical protein